MKNDFDKFIGLKTIQRKKGYCKVKLDIKPHHLNKGGIVHGGVLATLCDVALSSAVATLMRKSQWCVTVQLQIQYMNPAFQEVIYGYGKVIRKGKTLAFVEGGIETKNKKKVTKAHGIWYIKDGPSKKLKITTKVKLLE